MARLTIHDIKRLSEEKNPYFFSHKTLKFFGQTMKSFSLYKLSEEVYYIEAPIYRYDYQRGKKIKAGLTQRWFDTRTNDLLNDNPESEAVPNV